MPRSIPGAHKPGAEQLQLNLFPKPHPCRADPVLAEGPAGEERCERPGTAPAGADPALMTALSSGHRFLSTSYNKVSYFGEEKPILCCAVAGAVAALPGTATSVCLSARRACVTAFPHQGQNLNNLDSCPGCHGQGSLNCRKRRLRRVYIGNRGRRRRERGGAGEPGPGLVGRERAVVPQGAWPKFLLLRGAIEKIKIIITKNKKSGPNLPQRRSWGILGCPQ